MKHLRKFESVDDVVNLKGWVNVKLDELLHIRMSRYVSALDKLMTNRLHRFNLYEKIRLLSEVDEKIKSADIDIQTKISIITLLQYLNELKSQFNPSAAGFLLEGFLATLIHGKKLDDYSPVDITTSYNELDAPQFVTEGQKKVKYQIKLYKKGSNIKVNWKSVCDFYVICLKESQTTEIIDVHILSGTPNVNFINSHIGQYVVIPRGEDRDEYIERLNSDNAPDSITINTNKLYSRNPHESKIKLDVSTEKINSLIKNCGEDIQQSIAKVYDHLSELHYNIDSLVSGQDKNRKRITIDMAKKRADRTISKIQREIEGLHSNISSQ